jgi:hypothetical protein
METREDQEMDVVTNIVIVVAIIAWVGLIVTMFMDGVHKTGAL